MDVLEPLFQKRNQLGLRSGLSSDKERFSKARRPTRKGVMRKCDNWRGIALLDVVG